MFKEIVEEILLENEYSKLQKNKVPLSKDERIKCFEKDAVWHYAFSTNPINGKKEKKVCAVWKSKDPKSGKFTYITNTHRAWNKAPTLEGAIDRYHKFIKETA